ncbi:MAG: hypothetical protein ACFFD4_03115 [Candidatus Odinarchaeota archaeon]
MSDTDHLEKNIDNQPSHALFLCFFDERRGHIILYTFPHYLLDDETEKKIISIHSIWWLKPDENKINVPDGDEGEFTAPEHVDLELAGRIYAAVEFRMKTSRKKRRSGMTGQLADEKFVLIARSSSVLSFISDEILDMAYNRIRNDIGKKLNYLVLQNLSLRGELPEEFVKEEVEKESETIIGHLDEICADVMPTKSASKLGQEVESRELSFKEQMSISILNKQLSSSPSDQTPQRIRKFTIGSDKKSKTAKETKEENVTNFTFAGHSISHLDEKIAFTVKNSSKVSILKPVISVTETRGFFEINKWDINLPVWKAGEKLVFKIPIGDLSQKEGNYIITVTEANEQLWIKKIAFADLQDGK